MVDEARDEEEMKDAEETDAVAGGSEDEKNWVDFCEP